ncbi:MAG: helix-turn-helix domain-containing protein [Thermofilum sp.]|nr:helix-turn-helix domain-containing protein [Thermofilum sp.]
MGRKRYDDDALRAKALELRREGLSYREIARRLGCSVYKVWELISPHENIRSRIKQVAELAQKLDELSRRVGEIEEKISRVRGLEGLAELASRIERLERVVSMMEDDLVIMQFSALYKVLENPCRWINGEGYCTLRCLEEWEIRGTNWVVRREVVDGEVVYRLNVKEHPWLCLECPFYEPRV